MKIVEVRALVAALHPNDTTEADHRLRLLELIESFDDPWNRDRFEPGHLTASAFVLHPDRRSIALVHHAKLDRWLQPGGHVESDDVDHEAAARREVAEECLIETMDTIGPIDLDIHLFPARDRQAGHLHYDLRWSFVSDTVDIGSGDGTLAVRWVPLEDVARNEEAGLRRAARKLLQLR